eukprot:gnl/TRDRNA2_/TRDRNA2_127309_c0_seq1.p1 gnl/TRDRNA2_/TRDRNA2_127309_c0~~gnl/TRDRNA2_/TRDRNA2_127309_c0_seq1.p1  ORF type:complete len:338 (+),score=36.55 gnl/TRDRNA2_/TRDRNA2_127309_c0_seq1:37-1050(+)
MTSSAWHDTNSVGAFPPCGHAIDMFFIAVACGAAIVTIAMEKFFGRFCPDLETVSNPAKQEAKRITYGAYIAAVIFAPLTYLTGFYFLFVESKLTSFFCAEMCRFLISLSARVVRIESSYLLGLLEAWESSPAVVQGREMLLAGRGDESSRLMELAFAIGTGFYVGDTFYEVLKLRDVSMLIHHAVSIAFYVLFYKTGALVLSGALMTVELSNSVALHFGYLGRVHGWRRLYWLGGVGKVTAYPIQRLILVPYLAMLVFPPSQGRKASLWYDLVQKECCTFAGPYSFVAATIIAIISGYFFFVCICPRLKSHFYIREAGKQAADAPRKNGKKSSKGD